MKELLLIVVASSIVNNVVLSQFLGLCPFLGVSKRVETAAGMGGAVIFVITIASFVTSVIFKFILQPLSFEGDLSRIDGTNICYAAEPIPGKQLVARLGSQLPSRKPDFLYLGRKFHSQSAPRLPSRRLILIIWDGS